MCVCSFLLFCFVVCFFRNWLLESAQFFSELKVALKVVKVLQP